MKIQTKNSIETEMESCSELDNEKFMVNLDSTPEEIIYQHSDFADRNQNLPAQELIEGLETSQINQKVDEIQKQTELLFNLYGVYGSKWTKISTFMVQRSQNWVKNRFYGCLRKALRKLNKMGKKFIKKMKKQVKYQSIIRIIEASDGVYRLGNLKQQGEDLAKKILLIARREKEQIQQNEAEELIFEINRFNILTRSYKAHRKTKNSNYHSNDEDSEEREVIKKLNKSCELSAFPSKTKQIEKEQEKGQIYQYGSKSTELQPQTEQEIEAEEARVRVRLDSMEELFTQMQSPLEGELWI